MEHFDLASVTYEKLFFDKKSFWGDATNRASFARIYIYTEEESTLFFGAWRRATASCGRLGLMCGLGFGRWLSPSPVASCQAFRRMEISVNRMPTNRTPTKSKGVVAVDREEFLSDPAEQGVHAGTFDAV